jgi:cytochrome d ubiquinol oxidase subunit II
LPPQLAPVLFGVALGNLVRGVPIDDNGWFALAPFDSFSPFGALGILDWFTVLAGLLGLTALAHHGALFLAWRTAWPVRDRAVGIAARLFPVVVLWAAATAATWTVAPGLVRGFLSRPLAWASAVIFLGGLASSLAARRAGRDRDAFLGSALFLLGLAATASSGYPVMIAAANDPSRSLTAFNAASSPEALRVGLYWWPAGFLLAVAYFVLLFRLHRGRVDAAEGSGHY